jgi:Zn-dependent protease
LNHIDFTPLGLLRIALQVLIVLFSLSIHESAHAWMADKLGDSTGRMLGRITLNPIPHIDLIGTILLPLVMALAGGPIFGWAKPVPVITRNFRHIRRDGALVGAAGPASNLLLAMVSTVVMAVTMAVMGKEAFFSQWQVVDTLPNWMFQLALINLILAAFNFIPIPPLDGSWVLSALLPGSLGRAYDEVRRFGPILLLILFLTPLLNLILSPIVNLLAGFLIVLPLQVVGMFLG